SDEKIAVFEDGRDASEGIPEAAVVWKNPALFQLASHPVETDILVVAVLLMRAIHQPGSGRNHRDHDVRIVHLAIDPRLVELSGFRIPYELLNSERRRSGNAGGEGVRKSGRLDGFGIRA